MKIPVYTAQASVTREAPGRQIRARQSPSAMAQAELDKAKPMQAALQAAGEYAQTRYKIQTQNNLDQALLDAEEGVNERLRELQKNPDYNSILDGDDPLWDKETSELLRDGLKKVGTDRYARQQFTSRFGNLEQRGRFALRDFVDEKVKIQAQINRDRNLQNTEDEIVNTPDLANTMLLLGNIETNTKKLGEVGAGNPEILSKQQYAMVKRSALRAVGKYADEAPSGIKFVENVRTALEEKSTPLVSKTSISSREEAYVLGLLKMLDPEDRADILSSVGGTQKYLEAPSVADQNSQKLAQSYLKIYDESIKVRTDRLSSGIVSSSDGLSDLENQIKDLAINLPQEEAAPLIQKFNDYKELNNFQVALNRMASIPAIDGVISRLESSGVPGKNLEGIDSDFEQSALKLAKDFKARLESELKPDGDIVGLAESIGMDGVTISPVDLSLEAVSADALDPRKEVKVDSGLSARIAQGIKIASRNDLDFIPVLKKSEMREVSNTVNGLKGEDGILYLRQLMGELDNRSQGVLIENMANLGLAPEYIQGFYMDNLAAARTLIENKDVPMSELKDAVRKDQSTGAGGIPSVMGNLSSLENYARAFISGGDGDAAFTRFSQQRDLAEKLAYLYVRAGASVADGVERAVDDVFNSDAVINANQQFLVPKQLDADKISESASDLLTRDGLKTFNIDPLEDSRLKLIENLEVNIASLISNGMWLNNGTGDGLVLHYDVNGSFLPVENVNGDVVEVSFKDLLDFNVRSIEDVEEEFDVGVSGESGTIALRSYDLSNNDQRNRATLSFYNMIQDEFPEDAIPELGLPELKEWANQNGFKYDDSILRVTQQMLRKGQ